MPSPTSMWSLTNQSTTLARSARHPSPRLGEFDTRLTIEETDRGRCSMLSDREERVGKKPGAEDEEEEESQGEYSDGD